MTHSQQNLKELSRASRLVEGSFSKMALLLTVVIYEAIMIVTVCVYSCEFEFRNEFHPKRSVWSPKFGVLMRIRLTKSAAIEEIDKFS